MSPEFLLEIRETATHILAFVAFFWIMKRYAWGPITRVLEERQKSIEQGFEQIRQKQEKADKLREDYEARLRDIEREARAKIQEAIQEGRRVAGEVTENARLEAARIREQAQRNIKLEIDKARLALRGEMVSITLEATERLLRERLDDAGHRKLVTAFINDIEERTHS